MFCVNCGRKVLGGDNFCSYCGEKIVRNTNPYRSNDEMNTLKDYPNDFRNIMNQYIGIYTEKYFGKKFYINYELYLKEMNILERYRAFCFVIPGIFLTFICGPIGIVMTLIFGLFPYVFLCHRTLSQENRVETHVRKRQNIRSLYDYLIRELCLYEIVPESYDEYSILIRFKNQTYHKINFENNMYQIICLRWTGKQFITGGFQRGSTVMLKNSIKINPILKGYIEYYTLKER